VAIGREGAGRHCQTGTKCPILQAQQDKVYPVVSRGACLRPGVRTTSGNSVRAVQASCLRASRCWTDRQTDTSTSRCCVWRVECTASGARHNYKCDMQDWPGSEQRRTSRRRMTMLTVQKVPVRPMPAEQCTMGGPSFGHRGRACQSVSQLVSQSANPSRKASTPRHEQPLRRHEPQTDECARTDGR
jgi:hypothetical protein